MSYDVRLVLCCLDPTISCADTYVCSFKRVAIEPVIFFCLDWLTGWLLSRTAPYFRLSLGVGSATFELNSYLDPWQLGLVTLFSVGYKQAPRPARPLGGKRGPALSSL